MGSPVYMLTPDLGTCPYHPLLPADTVLSLITVIHVPTRQPVYKAETFSFFFLGQKAETFPCIVRCRQECGKTKVP